MFLHKKRIGPKQSSYGHRKEIISKTLAIYKELEKYKEVLANKNKNISEEKLTIIQLPSV